MTIIRHYRFLLLFFSGIFFSSFGWSLIACSGLVGLPLLQPAMAVETAPRNRLWADTIPLPARYLSEYVQIESVTGNEKEAGLFLAQRARDKGLYVRVFTDQTDSYNFTASLYPLEHGKPNIILLNHIDVVPSGEDSLWTYPPFSGAIAEGYVWGRGAIDNKAMGIMQLLALADFVGMAKENDVPYNVTMLAVSGEETGGKKGAAVIVNQFLDELNPVVVFGEGGTGLKEVVYARPDMPFFVIETAQKTGLWFFVQSFDPASGHGSVPREIYPAKQIVTGAASLLNYKQPIILTKPAKDLLREIGRHERGMRKVALRNIGIFRHFIGRTLRADPITNALLTNTVTLTGLRSSEGAYNQISHTAKAVFDSRLLPGTDVEDFMKIVSQFFDEDHDHIEVINHAPESGISETGFFYEALQDAVYEVFGDVAVAPGLFPAHNDNTFFRQKGIPAYGLLPVILTLELVESIHNVDERIGVQSLMDGVDVYKALINKLLVP